MNFARLNHILIPATKRERDVLRKGRLRWLIRPASFLHGALSQEGRALSLLLLLIAVAGLDVGVTQVYLLFSALTGTLVASFAIRPFFRLPGASIRVHAPPRVTRGEMCELEIELSSSAARDHLSLRIVRPFLPWDGQWDGPAPRIAHLPAHGKACTRAKARFVARGAHHIDSFSVAALVPLGLAMGPPVHGAGVRFTVVPRIALVTSVELADRSDAPLTGTDASAHRAEAQDLCGVRPYRFGDSVKHLHARTWARVGIPHVREFQEPRLRRVVVVFVTEAGQVSEDAFEARVSVAAGVVAHLLDRGVRTDVVFDDATIGCSVGLGFGTLETVLDTLASVEPSKRAAPELAPRLPADADGEIGAVIVVGPPNHGASRALASELIQGGPPCRGIWVGDAAAASVHLPAGFSLVDARRVLKGQEIAL